MNYHMIVYKSCRMAHKYGNAVSTSSCPNALFCFFFLLHYIFAERVRHHVMLINFPLRLLFFHVSHNRLVSVNNFKAFQEVSGDKRRKRKRKKKSSKSGEERERERKHN